MTADAYSYLAPQALRIRSSGRLEGWSIPAKDLYDVTGMPTSLGSVHRRYLAQRTEPFLQRLLDQGASIPGKTAVPELGLTIHTEPVGMPAVDNPLYPGHTPGGSSGGAAVLVASRQVRAAHASDGGGSIRVPAAATGTVGFMPSHRGLSAQGFITRTVADQAFLHGVRPRRRRLRVGVLDQPLFAATQVEDSWLQALHEATECLDAELVSVHPWPTVDQSFEYFTDIFSSALNKVENTEGLAAWLQARGRRVSPARLRRANAHAQELADLLGQYWDIDVLATPMLASDPPPIGAFSTLAPSNNFWAQTRWSPWASLFNLMGTSAISVPWPRRGRPPAAVHFGAVRVDDAHLLGLALQVHP